MNKTKTIKISPEIYRSLSFFKYTVDEDNRKNNGNVIYSLIIESQEHKNEIIHDDEGYFLVVDGRKKKIPSFSSPNKIIRLSERLYNRLDRLKIHPDESFNMTLFRLISCHYGNKPIYRIFENGCGNCEELKETLQDLMEEPIFNENIVIEYQDPDEYREIVSKYVDSEGYIIFPLALLYDHNGELVNHSTGYVLDDELKKVFENVISLMPEKIEEKLTITSNTKHKQKTKSKTQETECSGNSCKIHVDNK